MLYPSYKYEYHAIESDACFGISLTAMVGGMRLCCYIPQVAPEGGIR